MTAPQQQRKEEAEALRLGVIAGLVTVADAVAWADDVIMADARPDAAILDVSLAGKKPVFEVAKLLGEVRGPLDSERASRRLLGRMLRLLDDDPRRGNELAVALYRLARNGALPDDRFGMEPYRLDDEFELERQGMYDLDLRLSAIDALRRYLLQHAL